MRQRQGSIFIGTSGWTYDGWRGPFYPPQVPKKDWLAAYGTHFATAEVNGSFYRTPSLEAVRAWLEQTPRGFVPGRRRNSSPIGSGSRKTARTRSP
jgi:uncharacterized protein YecE (DUF72 family)